MSEEKVSVTEEIISKTEDNNADEGRVASSVATVSADDGKFSEAAKEEARAEKIYKAEKIAEKEAAKAVKLSEFYNDKRKNHRAASNVLMFAVMPFAYFVILGLPGKVGAYVSAYSNFFVQVFFILFGFFTLVPDREERLTKLKFALKRSSKYFVGMFFCFIGLSAAYLAVYGALPYMVSEQILRKRTLFEFLVFNIWPLPVGNSIWVVQSLVYAFLFFLIAEKLKLSKLYTPLMILLIIFMLGSGEFASFCGFPIYKYSYIPGGAVTRALPYMLIGWALRNNIDKLAKIPRYVYPLGFLLGLGAAVGEIELLRHLNRLVYAGHTIGFGIMALSLCCLALTNIKPQNNFLSFRGNAISRRMYVLCQPMSFLVWLLLVFIGPEYLYMERETTSLITFVISLFIAIAVDLLLFEKAAGEGVQLRKGFKNLRKNIKYGWRYHKNTAVENKAKSKNNRREFRQELKYGWLLHKEDAAYNKSRRQRSRAKFRRNMRYELKHIKHQIQRKLGLRK